jgi:hypothetical protein
LEELECAFGVVGKNSSSGTPWSALPIFLANSPKRGQDEKEKQNDGKLSNE